LSTKKIKIEGRESEKKKNQTQERNCTENRTIGKGTKQKTQRGEGRPSKKILGRFHFWNRLGSRMVVNQKGQATKIYTTGQQQKKA